LRFGWCELIFSTESSCTSSNIESGDSAVLMQVLCQTL
jgi:hypothetical protein